jgi:hypothetical protein
VRAFASGAGPVGGSSARVQDARLDRLSTAAIVLMVAAMALVLALPFVTVLQADSFKALYDGRWIAGHGVPSIEALTVAAHGRAWVDEQWLAELAYYEGWALGGYGLVAVVSALAVASAYAVLAALMLRRGASLLVVAAASVFAILTGYGWTFTRAQDLALPLFAALLAICLTDAEHEVPQRRLVLLVPVLALWANIHGSVILGAALATAYLLQRAARARGSSRTAARWCVALAVCTPLTPLATPYGLHIAHYYGEFLGNPMLRTANTEWSHPAFPTPSFFELYGGLAILLALGLRAWRRTESVPRLVPVAAVLITAVAAWSESGNLVWFGMAAAILIADTALTKPKQAKSTLPGVLATGTTALAILATAITVLATRTQAGYEQVIPTRLLASVTTYALAHPCATILADNWDGSALLWQSPALQGRIAFDARLEQYPQPPLSRWATYQSGTGKNWPTTISGYSILIANTAYTPATVKRLERIQDGHILVQGPKGIAVLHPTPHKTCIQNPT